MRIIRDINMSHNHDKNAFPINEVNPKDIIDTHKIELEKLRDDRYRKYDIPVGVFFSQSEHLLFTKDEEKAMYYLDSHLELPKELEQKLLDTLSERLERNTKIEKTVVQRH